MDVKARLERALSQRMYLISAKNISKEEWHFEVEGASGKIYKLVFDNNKMKCGCPDYYTRRSVCKHIYFIIGRVLKDLKLLENIGGDPNVSIFSICETITDDLNRTLNSRSGSAAWDSTAASSEIPNAGDDCSICYEELVDSKTPGDFSRCRTCKNFFHKECINIWLRKATRCNCPLCRSTWSTVSEIVGPDDLMAKFRILGS